MTFEVQKQAALTKLKDNDKSKAGVVDEQIQQVVTLLNSHKDCYTTSSCAGRILIYQKEQGAKKNQIEWLFKSHKQVNIEQVKQALQTITHNIWFTAEPVVLHSATKDITTANTLLKLANQAGLKGGATGMDKKVMVEIKGVDYLSTILAKDGKLVVDEQYLGILVQEANLKMKRNTTRIQAFQAILSRLNPQTAEEAAPSEVANN